jgi:hypothetical protein
VTVGILEGWSSSVGDELTELAGFRSTRLTTILQTEKQHQSGINTASTTQSTTALLGTWTWRGGTLDELVVLSTNTTQVVARDFIRNDADTQWFRIVSISAGTGPSGEDEVTIENPDSLTIPNTATASSKANPDPITIPGSPDFLVTVAAGMRFRILSGPLTGLDLVIASRDSGIQITPETGLPASLAAVSWEIVVDAETVAEVETTLDWDASGRFFLDGVLYSYASKTLTTLEGLQHFDGITFVDGALGKKVTGGGRTDHVPLAVVADFSRTYSAVDLARRAFLVDFATGTDLDVIGANLGVPRPPQLSDDETYRNLIKATAYTPRGTIYALELALTALLGPGNFEIFEDLTLGSINHPARVYFRRTDFDSNLLSSGKAYVEGPEHQTIVSTTQIDADEDPIAVEGVRLAPEGGIRQSASGSAASSTTGESLTGPAAEFPADIEPNDLVRILDGPQRGQESMVRKRVSDTQVDLMERIPGLVAASWETVRRGTPTRTQRPTADVSSEFGIVPTEHWIYIGNGTENTEVTLLADDPVDGDVMEMTTAVNATTAGYAKRLRIQPDSDAYVEVRLSPQNAPPHGSFGGDLPPATDGEQFYIGLTDGLVDIRVGVFNDGGASRFRFIDQVGNRFTFMTTGVGQNIGPGAWGTIRIVKRGRESVELWVGRDIAAREGMRLVQSAPWSAFPFSTAKDFVFGLLATTQSGYTMRTKELQYGVRTPTDYWNTRITNGNTKAPNGVVDGGGLNYFLATDADPPAKSIRIFDFTTPNAGGGTPVGAWEIASFVNLNEVTVVGATQQGARMRAAFPARITIRGDRFPFVWPHVRGHKIVIETGPNAGTYDIGTILDPETLTDVDLFPDMAVGAQVAELPEVRTNVLEVSNPPAGGFLNDDEASWHIEPVFAVDAGPIVFETVDTGNVQNGNELHFDRQALPIGTIGSWNPIYEILYSRVLSAQARDERDTNELVSPGVYTMYPFYLEDSWGFLRGVLDQLTVAGVLPDFDGFFTDAAGSHIID